LGGNFQNLDITKLKEKKWSLSFNLSSNKFNLKIKKEQFGFSFSNYE
jgi:hypothetical protein